MTLHATAPRSAVRRLATARFISLAGSAAAATALSYVVYERSGEKTIWLSAALVVTFGAQALFTPFMGSLGDRFDRRRLLIGSDLAAAAGFAVLMFVSAPAWMLVVAFLASVAESPFYSVSAAAVPNLAGEERLSWANGLIGVGSNVGFLIGPVLGGGLIAVLAGQNTAQELRAAGYVVFGLNAVSFVASALLVASIHGRFHEETPAAEPRGSGGMREGVSYLLHDRVLRGLALAWMVFLFGAGATLVAELPLSKLFGAGALGYGLLTSMWAAGAALGSFVGSRTLNARREPAALVVGMAFMAVGLGVIGIAPWFALALALMLLAGVGEGYSGVAEHSVIQRCSPDRLRSRVMSIGDGAVMGVFTVSFLLGAPLIALFGVRGTYVLAGVAALLGGVVMLTIVGEARARSGAATDEPEPAINNIGVL